MAEFRDRGSDLGATVELTMEDLEAMGSGGGTPPSAAPPAAAPAPRGLSEASGFDGAPRGAALVEPTDGAGHERGSGTDPLLAALKEMDAERRAGGEVDFSGRISDDYMDEIRHEPLKLKYAIQALKSGYGASADSAPTSNLFKGRGANEVLGILHQAYEKASRDADTVGNKNFITDLENLMGQFGPHATDTALRNAAGKLIRDYHAADAAPPRAPARAAVERRGGRALPPSEQRRLAGREGRVANPRLRQAFRAPASEPVRDRRGDNPLTHVYTPLDARRGGAGGADPLRQAVHAPSSEAVRGRPAAEERVVVFAEVVQPTSFFGMRGGGEKRVRFTADAMGAITKISAENLGIKTEFLMRDMLDPIAEKAAPGVAGQSREAPVYQEAARNAARNFARRFDPRICI